MFLKECCGFSDLNSWAVAFLSFNGLLRYLQNRHIKCIFPASHWVWPCPDREDLCDSWITGVTHSIPQIPARTYLALTQHLRCTYHRTQGHYKLQCVCFHLWLHGAIHKVLSSPVLERYTKNCFKVHLLFLLHNKLIWGFLRKYL